ncbi:hypothetical protein CSUI_005148, partial [Cystoisospora suis]
RPLAWRRRPNSSLWCVGALNEVCVSGVSYRPLILPICCRRDRKGKRNNFAESSHRPFHVVALHGFEENRRGSFSVLFMLLVAVIFPMAGRTVFC